MHLNECLQLAFSQPIESSNNAAAVADIISSDQQSVMSPFLTNDNNNNNNNSSSLETQQYVGDSNNDNFDIQRKGKGGSIYAMLQCILSDWTSQTNFYIPDDHYDGYSYLFEDNGWGGYDNRIAANAIHQNYHQQHSGSSVHHHHHHQPAYKVYAKDPNNLHSHHYDVYMHGNLTQTTMHASPINVLLLHHPNHQPNSNDVITTSTHSKSSNNHLLLLHHHQHSQTTPHPMMMTIPYLHPTLKIPVPPLQLPYYFGALCWSYAIAGMLILYMPPKWCSCGGGRRRRRVVVVGSSRRNSVSGKLFVCECLHFV